MINQIRRFLIQHDPTIRALKPQLSENLHTPLEAPKIHGTSGEELQTPTTGSLPSIQANES